MKSDLVTKKWEVIQFIIVAYGNSTLLFYMPALDLKSIGHTLSWSNRQTDLISCRLDRVLGNQMFISSFPHSLVEYLQPGISYHSPMKVIFEPPFPTGPKPFKYFEAWEEHPSFSTTVQSAWNLNVSGNPLFCFIAKLSNLKRILKIWNRDIYGPIQNSFASSKRSLEEAQIALHQSPHDPVLITSEKSKRESYQSLLNQEEKIARQKSRQLWLEAATFEEVHIAVFIMKALSSPSPDEFPTKFFQSFWTIIKEDLLHAINFFFTTGKLPPGLGALKCLPYLEIVIIEESTHIETINGIQGKSTEEQ
ncbi:hypothetical protein QJS10_CPB21g00747 [Acorus calamus]|uniref:Uncharacterized protein n=1 Tax=Acorus calamus TaxID=4465 RepID=A0AAV9C8Q9_ACOCL|nr:hypothetical protein QJS10_CPB21g00747 [Acorus calamus]